MKKSKQQSMAQRALDRDTSPRANRGIFDALTGQALQAQRGTTKPLEGLTRAIDVRYVKPDPNQPRKSMDPERLKELADSIKEHGLINAITVSQDTDGETYTVIAGHRRFAASKLAGVKMIPAWIRPGTIDGRRRLEEQLVENLQREDLPVLEEARAIQALVETTGLSQRNAAKALGKPRTYITEMLHILRIEEPLLAKLTGMPKRALVEISRGETPKEQQALAKQALASPTPFRDVKESRGKKREPRKETFRKTYGAEGWPGTVTVSMERHPDDVTPEEVVKFLGKVVQTIVAEEVKGE